MTFPVHRKSVGRSGSTRAIGSVAFHGMKSLYSHRLALPLVMFFAARSRVVAWLPHRIPRSTVVVISSVDQRFLSFRSRPSSRRRVGNQDLEVDDQGRRVRRRRREDVGTSWDDFDPSASAESSSSPDTREEGGGWDDFDPFVDKQQLRPAPARRRGGGRAYQRAPDRDNRGDRSYPPKGPRKGRREESPPADDRKTNLKALDGAGFVHLYGLASVLNALHADRRDFTRPEDLIDLDDLPPEDMEHEMQQRQRKPEAQFSPWLFVQERGSRGARSSDKVMLAEETEQLARERNIPIATVDKGVLNTLSSNRPHQGYVLRCGKLNFEPLSRVPHPQKDPLSPSLWLVLDEVVDPQNLGALLRSAYFLGGKKIGILLCSKNSAPPSPVVSAASAGALELAKVYETSNLPKTLMSAQQDGFRILGASSSVPRDTQASLYDLEDLPTSDRPTLLVLGSEGHGLRTLVARACTDFVRIPGGVGAAEDSVAGVDSLNVSVTGGILVWQLLQAALR